MAIFVEIVVFEPPFDNSPKVDPTPPRVRLIVGLMDHELPAAVRPWGSEERIFLNAKGIGLRYSFVHEGLDLCFFLRHLPGAPSEPSNGADRVLPWPEFPKIPDLGVFHSDEPEERG